MERDTLDGTHRHPLHSCLRKTRLGVVPRTLTGNPHDKSHTWTSSCSDAEVGKVWNTSLRYSVGNRTGEYHRGLYDGSQVSEGFRGTIIEQLCSILLDLQLTPIMSIVEYVTSPDGKGDSMQRYNLWPFSGRNI